MIHLKELIEKYNLHERVELLGGLPHDKVRDVLCRGHIFLNTSLTESFCIAILEAACCGLLVVTTDVGGVPEVLPPHMAYLARPEERAIIKQLRRAVVDVKKISCDGFNEQLSKLYSWRAVAQRTEKVYDNIMDLPIPNMLSRIKSAYGWGPIVGLIGVLFTLMEVITIFFTELFWPETNIDVSRSFNATQYNENITKVGSHEFYANNKDKR